MFHNITHRSLVLTPLNRERKANMNVIDEEFDCAPKGTLAYRLGFLEQRPWLQLVHLLCGREVFIQAQLDPRQTLAPSQCDLVVFVRCELE
jgi:hypothetical protein